ncbi:hypothetical protein FOWG_10165 [Fusarium oxysporum f. sp. lycopersici MN25]|nr:hypothetical protein FOWG_10165 [Fusarium oxysporum f. sp. lycopersici MN25]
MSPAVDRTDERCLDCEHARRPNGVNKKADKTCVECGREIQLASKALNEAGEYIGILGLISGEGELWIWEPKKSEKRPSNMEEGESSGQGTQATAADTTYIPTMSENVQKTTTQVRGDHTKWQCHKMVNEPGHARCVATMSMNVDTCTHCGQRRGKNAVALAQNDDVLGSLVDFEADGTEKWHYNLKVNGVHN